ncbi:PepSY-like domain-containing protein [Mesonia aquimarina]|uniref:PepSY-like domain-containing protein n=1 Tax=Mesonia aquimarina TaxID=1504967 RepID=UPI000EF5D1AD|nr:PepSY-like domain-containing protein [Mesonia aquimarina]
MKKLILSGILGLLTIGFTTAQEIKDFPSAAQDVVKTHYSKERIKKVDVDKRDQDEMYQVKFENGTKIDFNSKGDITQIKGNEEIPAELIPKKLRDYVNSHHKNKKITEWDFDGEEHEIELNDGTELEFTKNGEFDEEYKFLGLNW